jgi:beta-ureidopropionase / N-carbamoyl-L-amino-acid hydrolase
MEPQLAATDYHMQVATAVDERRLWQRHLKMAVFGARDDGGVNRQALSPADVSARIQLIEWATSRGYACATDPVGNLFVRREGRNPSLPAILTGSHLDSQPAGGKFDGVYGVLAGMEVLHALDTVGVATERAIEVVAWTNEEGSRFVPGMAGSSAFAGTLPLEKLLATRDREGILFEDALASVLAATPNVKRRALGFPVGAYLEAHIEQGPVLESTRCGIGVVAGIQGTRWFTVHVKGASAHAGTTPLAMRRDAFKATTSIVTALSSLLADGDDVLRFTVGRVVVEPNSPNTVPGSVQFTIDFRHPDFEILKKLGDRVESTCMEHAGKCDILVNETLNMSPIQFDKTITDIVSAAADELGLARMFLTSGAFHDAKSLSEMCPTGMIFVPCANGISHSPSENADPAGLAAGARVLALAVEQLAQRTTLSSPGRR